MQRTLAILRAILAFFQRPYGRCRRGMSFFLLDTLPALRDGTLTSGRDILEVNFLASPWPRILS
jgi:hypothetical protein